MMARRMVAGNWKMNMVADSAKELVRSLSVADAPCGVDIVLFPPLIWLRELMSEAGDGGLYFGGQDCHEADFGAFTGDISARMLSVAGCSHVIVGHSERRKFHGEGDARVLAKARAALEHGLIPIVCIGESLENRERGETFEHLGRQLDAGLVPLGDDLTRVIVAYEPLWAIGTGRTATPEQAQEVHEFLRGRLHAAAPDQDVQDFPILYGGSVKPANAAFLMEQPDIDGFLVGGASLEFESFWAIIKAAGVDG